VKAKTYQAKEFAQLLGISKSHLLKLEGEGKLPPAKRVRRGKVDHRYYTVEDIPVYRELLGLPPLITDRRTQLFLNFKGGTGKSSISASWAYQLAEIGLRVLAIDLDPQSHLTKCLGVTTTSEHLSLFEVLIEDVDINQAITPTSMPNLDLIPGTLRLSIIESRLLNKDMREFLLKAALERVETDYQVIVIDALPTITLLNKNAVLAADDLIVPVLADYLSYDGLGLLFHELSRMEKSFSIYNPDGESNQALFENIHIIINQYSKNETIARQNLSALRKHYSRYLCNTIIPRNTKVSQATAMGMPVMQYDPSCIASRRIRTLIEEVYGF